MAVWVVLLRGVNVGGAAKLPMAAFRAVLEDLGLRRVETCIQSGNAVFDSELTAAELEVMIRGGIAARCGFAPECFVLTADEIGAALTDHPFQGGEGNRVHVVFLRETPAPDEATLRALALPGDGWSVASGRFTLHTPGGYGSSKLAEKLPRLLPAPMTARNLRTVAALVAMVRARG